MLVRIHRTFESLTLAVLLAVGLTPMAMAQQPNTTPPNNTPSTPPVNRTEMDNFSQFLLNHPGVAQQLQQNPALINDPNFQAQHPQLQTFLKNHPGVVQQVQANPTRFVNDTRQFMNRGGEITPGQAARTDQFLDNHPKIAQELQKDPGLINDPQYLANHPGLQQYLNNHPDIRKEWMANPKAFEGREAQFEKNMTHAQLASNDQFLANHQAIAQELQKDPKLIDNPQYLANHPELKQYLNNHPEIRQEWREHPYKYEKRQTQYDKNHPPKSQHTKN